MDNRQDALDCAFAGHNVYIGGQAGTGKTYLITQIFDKLRANGKNVSMCCTTGISCSVFPIRCQVQTIHAWSGIDDGRYDRSYIQNIVRNYKKDKCQKIINTDVLIVDEVSMLSFKLFEQLEAACSLKNPSLLFGGIQVIFSGDFYQLPPVRNNMYNDDGKFCFESDLFKRAFPHKIILTKVVRQSDINFIKCVNDVSKGTMTEESSKLLRSLGRRFSDDAPSIKLFSTNDLVDEYNRHSILQMSGDLYEYKSEDKGDDNYLHSVLAPPNLWLKEGFPVILVRNISNKLVNGLRGTIKSCGSSGPVVNFPTVDVTTTLQRETFSGITY